MPDRSHDRFAAALFRLLAARPGFRRRGCSGAAPPPAGWSPTRRPCASAAGPRTAGRTGRRADGAGRRSIPPRPRVRPSPPSRRSAIAGRVRLRRLARRSPRASRSATPALGAGSTDAASLAARSLAPLRPPPPPALTPPTRVLRAPPARAAAQRFVETAAARRPRPRRLSG